MKKLFAYIRVSTVKQGEHGVSLQEQRDAINRYAQQHNLEIANWFVETVTAAKRGRPTFIRMLELLRSGKSEGVVIHKIDRGARNLEDWNDIGKLADAGVDVHFATENVDLKTTGGRLAADIQAVVATHYSRNLREETRKGFYGRIKQGLFPMPAPLGYLDAGGGKPKVPDPEKAPLIQLAFELYSSGRYSVRSLVEEMHRRGLRSKSGKTIRASVLGEILGSPFYISMIRLKRTGEIFPGVHQPLISASLFEQVQHVLSGRAQRQGLKHDFLFRRLLRCDHCGYCLIGELQKERVYYRCHVATCPGASIREDTAEASLLAEIKKLVFTKEEEDYLREAVEDLKHNWEQQDHNQLISLQQKESVLSDRLNRLTDAYLDGLIDRELFEQRKKALLMERRAVQDQISQPEAVHGQVPSELEKFLELAKSAYLQYETGLVAEKRELVQIVTSNRTVRDKTPMFALDIPFREIASRHEMQTGDPVQDTRRTWEALLPRLSAWLYEKQTGFRSHPPGHLRAA